MKSFHFRSFSRNKRIVFVVSAIVILLIGLLVSNTLKTDPVLSITPIVEPQPLEGSVVLSKNEIWPHKTLESQNTEYRLTSKPNLVDAYCVNQFTDGSVTYEFIGRSQSPDYNVTCG